MIQKIIFSLAVGGAVVNSLVMVVTWWWAAFHGWQATVILSRYHEHWGEGIMFHAVALATAWIIWPYWRKPETLHKDFGVHL